MKIGGAPVTNFEGGSYGKIDLVNATMKSVNTVFAQLAVEMGAPALVKQADLFGFDRKYGYEIGAKTSLMPDPAEMTTWETAWAGVGQPVGEHDSPAGPQATVMQMALVSAGIANGGEVMKPFVVRSIRNDVGAEVGTTRPQVMTRATDPATAATVGEHHGEGRDRAAPARALASAACASPARPEPPRSARAGRRTRGSSRSRPPRTPPSRSRS